MVDIIHRSSTEQIYIPVLLSTVSANDRANLLFNAKHWFGRCPGDPPRQLNISDPPYQLHRKSISREFSQCFSTTVEVGSTLMKIKPPQQQQQRTSNKELLKVTTVATNSILTNVDATHSRLLDAFSKHFTLKTEPIRPVNNFVNSSTNTASSWQRYWTSTQAQRRRKDAKDFQAALSRSKHDNQSNLPKAHLVTIRNSSIHINPDHNTDSQTSSTKPVSPVVPVQQSLLTKREDPFSLPPLVSLREKTFPMNLLRHFAERSLSLSESESTIVNDDDDDDTEINTITAQIYKLPLPSTKPKKDKPIVKRRSRSKSSERKLVMPARIIERKEKVKTPLLPNPSVSKRRHPIPSNKSHRILTKKQQQSLATVISTTSRSKYEKTQWEEPYTGVRFDPPTPPSSPSLFAWPQDDESEVSYERNSTDKGF